MELRLISMFMSPYLTGRIYVNAVNINLDFTVAQVTMLNAMGDTNLIDTVSSGSFHGTWGI